jgi:hypothetical protein
MGIGEEEKRTVETARTKKGTKMLAASNVSRAFMHLMLHAMSLCFFIRRQLYFPSPCEDIFDVKYVEQSVASRVVSSFKFP